MAADTQVVIVGAGAAGLAAARTLQARDVSCVVLEARDRVGGRIWTQDHAGTPIDLGGQWIGPGQSNVLALIRELGVDMFESGLEVPLHRQGSYSLVTEGEVLRYTDFHDAPMPRNIRESLHAALAELAEHTSTIDTEAPWLSPDAAHWDATTVSSWLATHLPDPRACAMFRVLQVDPLAADPADLSMLSLLFNNATTRAGTMPERWRVRGGAQQLTERMAADLVEPVRLRHEVRGLAWHQDGVTVDADSGEVTAARAIIALPPVLAGRLRYEPAMPPGRDGLTSRYPSTSVIKVQAVYERPFWRDSDRNGWALLPGGDPLWIIGDNSPPDGSRGVLIGFISAHAATSWTAVPAPARRAAVLNACAGVFGPTALHPVAYVEANWAAEPYSRGCFQGFPTTGTWTQFGEAWRRAVGPIHWAGTEYASKWYGYIEGALVSGTDVANGVADEIGELASG